MTSFLVAPFRDINWQQAIIDIVSSLPATPSKGDRYILNNDNKVYYYDGTNWQNYLCREGTIVYILNKRRKYIFLENTWTQYPYIYSNFDSNEYSTSSKNYQKVKTYTFNLSHSIQLYSLFISFNSYIKKGFWKSERDASLLLKLDDTIDLIEVHLYNCGWNLQSIQNVLDNNVLSGTHTLDLYIKKDKSGSIKVKEIKIILTEL